MSFEEVPAPDTRGCESTPCIEQIIEPRPRDLGGLVVRRLLPSVRRRMLGPFIFFDHMGPVDFPPGTGIDVRPHPHINLATVTYLFDGEIVHKDSLGSDQVIAPGAINWMTAGRGIVHSERTSPAARQRGQRVHGLQLWVALPTLDEELAPEFFHHSAATLPRVDWPGVSAHILAGSAYGEVSPVRVSSPLFYVEAKLRRGAELTLPNEHSERGAYVVEGEVVCGQESVTQPKLLLFRAGERVLLRALTDARVMLLGGEPLDGPRHIFWNFVSSSKERIERAKQDWVEQRFPLVPGDEHEFIPLPAEAGKQGSA